MLNEYQINALPERIVRRLEKINSDYLIAIGERIKEVGDLRPTEAHQLQRIYKNTRNIDAISAQLAALSDKTEKEIYDIFETVAKENYDYSEPFFKAQGKPFVPFSQNKELKDYVQAVAMQTVGEFKNLAQHTAFMVFGKNGEVVPTYFGMSNKVPTSLSETYTKITDIAIQKVQMGTESYQSAMREVMRTMADSGIRTVEYATGYSRRLDTAVRQNILWGVKQCNQETADMVGKAFGADGVEISYHSNPRDTHAEMGGKQYALGKAQTINGVHYPSFDTVKHLLDEPNCLHFKFSILLGVSEPAYDADELEQLKANDRKTFTYDGKKYTGYEATQAQRKLETAFRHSSDRYTIAKAAGDKDMMLKEQTRMTQISQKYNDFSKSAGLPTKVERLNSGISSKSLTNRTDGGIINMNRKTKNSGAFSILQERMSKKRVREVAKEYGIDLGGLKISIDDNEELLALPFAGRADSEDVGGITFFPVAFKSKEELVRTLFHEKIHVQQYKKHGVKYVQEHRERFEQQAYEQEERFIKELKEKGGL